jgi:hypothetical protein
MDGHDASGHPEPVDRAEPRGEHDLGHPLRCRVVAGRADEVGVGLTLAHDAADEGHDVVEPAADEPTDPAPGARDIEAHDAAAGPDSARQLAEAPLVVGQVAHAEGDGGGVELPIADRQRARVADDVGRPRLGGAPAGLRDHAHRKIDPERAAAGLDGAV